MWPCNSSIKPAKRNAGKRMIERSPTRIAVAVVENNDRFLIGQRPPGVALAGLWEFPGGKVEPEEIVADAAVRECLEETGLPVVAVGEISRVTQEYAHGLVEVAFIACKPAPAIEEQRVLRQPFRWVERAELSRYEFPAANAALVAQLLRESDA
jgi:mutator protein MutT